MTLVSVIVTTKNEEANIRRCLTSIKRQTYRNIELIVVDNHSTDRTKDIANEFTPHVFNLGPERSAQRNWGIRQARGEIVLYIDADMALSPGVVAACVQAFDNDPATVGLYIPERIVGQGFWIQVRDHERSFYNGTVVDAVRAVRKEAFEAIGGFDEALTGVEDWDFDIRIRRLGKTAVIQPALLHNEHIFDIKKYLQKKSYYSHSFAAYQKKWRQTEPAVIQQFDFGYRYFFVFTEEGKFTRLLVHPILTVGMLCLRFAVGVAYLAASKNISPDQSSRYPSSGEKDAPSERKRSA